MRIVRSFKLYWFTRALGIDGLLVQKASVGVRGLQVIHPLNQSTPQSKW